MPGKIDINLQATANTSTIDEDIKPFGDQNAPHILNTGVLQDGGITNLYEQEEIYAQAGEYYITDDNEVLSAIVDPNDANKVVISLEGKPLGSVSAYGVRARHKIQNVDDVVITDDDSYLTCKLSGGSIIITEYNLYTGAQLNTRTTTWANLATLGGFYTSLSFVRKDGLSYANSLEFFLRIGDSGTVLYESVLGAELIFPNVQHSYPALRGTIIASCVVNGILFVVTNLDGHVSTFDGNAWKFFDGTGNGSGPYTQYALGATGGAVQCCASYAGSFVVSGQNGRVTSYKNGWKYYNGTGEGQGIYNSGTHNNNQQVNTIVQATFGGIDYCVFGSGTGLLSSYGTSWNNYNSGGFYSSNAGIVGADNITRLCTITGGRVVVCGASGRVGNIQGGNLTTYLGGGAGVQPYNNAVVIGATSISAAVDTPWGLVIAGGTRCGSWNSVSGWKNYDGTGAGTGPFKNTWGSGLSVTWGLYATTPLGDTWLILSGTNDLESFDGIAWSDGAGTGPRLNSDTTRSINTGVQYGSFIIFSGIAVYQMGGSDYMTFKGLPARLPIDGTAPDAVCVYNNKLHKLVTAGGVTKLYRMDDTWVDLGAAFTSAVVGQAAMCVYSSYLVFAENTGKVSSWDGTNMKLDSGAGTGLGPFNSGAAMGNVAVFCMAEFSGQLVIAGASGRLASWTGAVWRAYNSGTQISNNATVLGAVTIATMIVYNTFLVVAGANGRVGSYDGANWKNYDATGTGTGPYNNTTASGNFTINQSAIYNFTLCLATDNGTLCSWNGSTWTNYNSGAGISDNQSITTAHGLLATVNNNLWFVGLASYKKYTTAGGTLYLGGHGRSSAKAGSYQCNWQNGIYAGDIYFSQGVILNSSIGYPCASPMFFGIESLSQPYVFGDDPTPLAEYLIVFNGSPQSTGIWLGLQGQTRPINVTYATRQLNSGGTSYHNISGTPQYYLTSLNAYATIGDITPATIARDPVYPTFGTQVGDILQWALGYGYCEVLHKRISSAVNIYNLYAPSYTKNQSAVVAGIQTQTNTRIDGYGKLTNGGGASPTVPLELRTGMINGEPSFISSAQYGTATDCVGVLLTNVGEFDASYGPQTEGDKNILYKSGAAFVICALDSTVSQRFERINEHLYKINTVSPSNLYDTLGGRFHVASSDYNGRMLITSAAVPAVSSTQIVGVQVGEFASSIDTGDKLITITSPTRDNYEIVGYILPDPGLVPDYAVDVYIADVYYASSRSDGTELVGPTKSGTLYLTTSSLPVAIGYPYNNGSLATLTSTVLLVDNYDGYEIGNELAGQYVAFQLFGQLYLFDGYNIYLATVQGGLIVAKTVTAPAQGLRFIAISPTEAIFCSDFDNSLHVFNGGRTLQKSLFFNRLDPILSGSWSVRDNSLLLDTASTFIFVRDSRITTLAKAADQSGLRIYTTTDGLVIGNNTGNWRYSYKAIGTVLPLAWQSAYFGLDTNNLAYVQNAVLVIQSPTRARLQVVANIQTFDEDTYYRNESAFDILPSMYNDKNVVRVRVQPPTQRGLAVSVGAEIDGKAVLAQATIDFTEDTTAGISAKATR